MRGGCLGEGFGGWWGAGCGPLRTFDKCSAKHAEIVSHEWPMQDTKGHFGLSNVRVCEGRLPSRVVCQAHAIMVDRKPVRTKICLIFMPPSSLDRLLQDSR